MLFLADTVGQIIDQGFPFANHWDILNDLDPNGGDYGYLLVGSANYRWSQRASQRRSHTPSRPIP